MKKLDDIERWKNSQKDLEEFNEIMKLIKQYPPKKLKEAPPCPPYEPSDFD